MISVVFVCHGNICRSPMAEYIFKDLVAQRGYSSKIKIFSRGVSDEEDGNDIYPPAKSCLDAHNIPYDEHHAKKLSMADLNDADFALCAEMKNVRLLRAIFGEDIKYKARILMMTSCSKNPRNIVDPWYYGNFEETYNDIVEGCTFFLDWLIAKGLI